MLAGKLIFIFKYLIERRCRSWAKVSAAAFGIKQIYYIKYYKKAVSAMGEGFGGGVDW